MLKHMMVPKEVKYYAACFWATDISCEIRITRPKLFQHAQENTRGNYANTVGCM